MDCLYSPEFSEVDIDNAADDLENYLETKERAEELDAKIEQADTLIDEIVYLLYGLTDEEIEIVEEKVGKQNPISRSSRLTSSVSANTIKRFNADALGFRCPTEIEIRQR
ncbi:hypothetical protein R3751_03400 [Halorubrum distributum]|nr:hypothetical protein [Halorubrum distributum]MDV7348823.1 hypothetical protein [Halorubrum distributum]